MGRRKLRGGARNDDAQQLGLPFDLPDATGVAPERSGEAFAREAPTAPPQSVRAVAAGGRLRISFWPGFMGRRPPPPSSNEQPLNTKRAAHHLGRSARWLEMMRHSENGPPWIKKGGLFEYYPSQLDWWLEQLAQTE